MLEANVSGRARTDRAFETPFRRGCGLQVIASLSGVCSRNKLTKVRNNSIICSGETAAAAAPGPAGHACGRPLAKERRLYTHGYFQGGGARVLVSARVHEDASFFAIWTQAASIT